MVIETTGGTTRFTQPTNATLPGGRIGDRNVIYIKNRNLVLGSPTQNEGKIVFPASKPADALQMPITFVVDGGDLIINSNIVTESCKDAGSPANCREPLVGFIVKAKNTGTSVQGGNIFIDPSVLNISGVFYGEGSVMTAEDGEASCGTSANNAIEDCEIFDGFSTFNAKLANQLYIKGVMITRNTIGGRDKDPSLLPLTPVFGNPDKAPEGAPYLFWPKELSTQDTQGSLTIASAKDLYLDFTKTLDSFIRRQAAQRYDLNYLRICGMRQDNGNGAFQGVYDASGRRWNGSSWAAAISGLITPSTDQNNKYPSVIFEYDSAVQTNTPPGFLAPKDIEIQPVR
jgi:hypothetical protein